MLHGGSGSDSMLRTTRRDLARLKTDGLVRRFVDRSRDRKVGAPGHVYALTAAGVRAVRASGGIGTRQRRAYRPSPHFIEHRLATTELLVGLSILERAGELRVLEFVAEPDCWRGSPGRWLAKPDLLTRLAVGGLEISWFVEVDLDSESSTVVEAKCEAYRAYELLGLEQLRYGVFPGVLFVVPTTKRATDVARVIRRQPANAQTLFAVAIAGTATAVMATAGDIPGGHRGPP